jgi:hypothetical protein
VYEDDGRMQARAVSTPEQNTAGCSEAVTRTRLGRDVEMRARCCLGGERSRVGHGRATWRARVGVGGYGVELQVALVGR